LLAGWAQAHAVIDMGFEVESHQIKTRSKGDKEKFKVMVAEVGNGGQWDITIDGSRNGKLDTYCEGTTVTHLDVRASGKNGYVEIKSKSNFPTDATTLKTHFVDYCKAVNRFRDHFDATPYCAKADILVDLPADKGLFKMNDVQINVGYKASMLQNEKTFMDNFKSGNGGTALLAPVVALANDPAYLANAAFQNIIQMWWNTAVWLAGKGKDWAGIKDAFIVLPKWDFCEVTKVALDNNVVTQQQLKTMGTTLGIAQAAADWQLANDPQNQDLPNPYKHFWPFDSFGANANPKGKCSVSANSFMAKPRFNNGEFEILFEYRKIAKEGACAAMVSAVEAEVKKQLVAVAADCTQVGVSASDAIGNCFAFLTAQVPQPPAPESPDVQGDYPAMEDLEDADDGEGVFVNDAFDGTITDEEARHLIGDELLSQINAHPDDYKFRQTPKANLKARLQAKKGLLEKN